MTVEFFSFPKIARLAREIIVTEKIDGTNGVICIGDDFEEFLVGSRTQWILPKAMGGADNMGFAAWAYAHKEELIQGLGPGRHFGEWWGSGVNRGYGLQKGDKRFSLFNVSRWGELTPPPACCSVVPVLYRGMFNTEAIDKCLEDLAVHGSVASPGFMKPEGVVVFHPQGNVGFKKTIERDEELKGKVLEAA